MAKAARSKVTADLAKRVASSADEEELVVIVELKPITVPRRASRRESIDALKRQFDEEARPVAEWINELGGEVIESAWVNQTLRTRIPKLALSRLERDDHIVSIDTPKRIASDA